MRFLMPLILLAPALVAVAADPRETKSALENDPAGWTDLFGKGLEGWKRVAIPAGSKLGDKDPWKYDAASGVLSCDGVGVHEMLLHQKEQGDGIFHVEWRFQKAEKTGYNSGVYVRNSADGAIWLCVPPSITSRRSKNSVSGSSLRRASSRNSRVPALTVTSGSLRLGQGA